MSVEGTKKIFRKYLQKIKNEDLVNDEARKNLDDALEVMCGYIDEHQEEIERLNNLMNDYKKRIDYLEKIMYEGAKEYLREHPEINAKKDKDIARLFFR